jgi:ParB family chromosome partitioning protein
LSALLGEQSEDYAELDRLRIAKAVPIELLEPSPLQPRRRFSEEEMTELVDSVRERGILQPILVRRHPDKSENFQIVAGERRWRAAQLAQLHEVPVIIKEVTDRDVLEVALIENIQRQSLTAVEEADGFSRLIDEFGYTQDELAQVLGKSRSHVANTLRLLKLPTSVRELVQGGQLTPGHARALISAEDPEELARRIIKRGLSVRQAERLAQQPVRESRAPMPRVSVKDLNTSQLERDLSNLLGLRVEIQIGRGGGGTLTIHYRNVEQLDDVLHRLDPTGARG